MKLLLSKIDNAPLDTLLTYFKVRRRDEQPEKEWTLYFSPWHKDRILRVSNGHRCGGLYNSPLWEVADSTANNTGYGAMSLVARLQNIAPDGSGLRSIIETICAVCGVSAPWLAEEARNGVCSLVDGQKEVTVQTSPDFSVEGLQALGCKVEHHGMSKRIYWTGDMLSILRRYFANTKTEEVAEMLGVSHRTVVRKARELGLEKDPSFLRQVWDENRLLAHVSNKKNGNSGQIKKGHTPWNKGLKLKEAV